jgi:hypothetical protein
MGVICIELQLTMPLHITLCILRSICNKGPELRHTLP